MMVYQDNILYIDVNNLDYRLMLTKNHPKKIRLLLGTINSTTFENTIETISHLSPEKEMEIRMYIKSLFKS